MWSAGPGSLRDTGKGAGRTPTPVNRRCHSGKIDSTYYLLLETFEKLYQKKKNTPHPPLFAYKVKLTVWNDLGQKLNIVYNVAFVEFKKKRRVWRCTQKLSALQECTVKLGLCLTRPGRRDVPGRPLALRTTGSDQNLTLCCVQSQRPPVGLALFLVLSVALAFVLETLSPYCVILPFVHDFFKNGILHILHCNTVR